MSTEQTVIAPEQHIRTIVSRHHMLDFVQTPDDLLSLRRSNLMWLLGEATRSSELLTKSGSYNRADLDERWSMCRFLKALVREARERPTFAMFRDRGWLANELQAAVHFGEPGDQNTWKLKRIATVKILKEFPQAVLFYSKEPPSESEWAFRAGWGMEMSELLTGGGYWLGYYSPALLLEWELEYLRCDRQFAEYFVRTWFSPDSSAREDYLSSLGFTSEASATA